MFFTGSNILSWLGNEHYFFREGLNSERYSIELENHRVAHRLLFNILACVIWMSSLLVFCFSSLLSKGIYIYTVVRPTKEKTCLSSEL